MKILSIWINWFICRVTEEEKRHADIALRKNQSLSVNATYDNTDDFEPVKIYIYIYSAIVISIFLVGITRSLLFYNLAMRCSQRLHDLVFGALIRTGMRFFDTNPSGRILNRFSKDMGAIDELLPKALLDAGQITMMMVGSLVVACTVNPIFIVPIVFISFIFYWIRKVYLKTSKNIKRLEGMSKLLDFLNIYILADRWSRTNPNCAQTQTSNKPKVRTNLNFEQTQTPNKSKFQTNQKVSGLRGT